MKKVLIVFAVFGSLFFPSPVAEKSRPLHGFQQQVFVFKMQSTWTAGDFHHQNPTKFVEIVEKASGGRIKINLMAAGAVVPAFEVLDAVNKGILDMGMPGRVIGSGNIRRQPFSAVWPAAPSGWTPGLAGWYYSGGEKLYNELLQKELKWPGCLCLFGRDL